MPQSKELKRYRCYEIFSQSTGVEIREAFKSHEENGQVTERSGRVQLRFFKLTPKTRPDEVTQIRFICEPDEAFALALMISRVAASGTPCKEKLTPHKFSSGDQGTETVTTLAVEKWERSGMSGYARLSGVARILSVCRRRFRNSFSPGSFSGQLQPNNAGWKGLRRSKHILSIAIHTYSMYGMCR